MTLRALIAGAGSAGEGHALALRAAGVEVVAIASRTKAVVEQVAARRLATEGFLALAVDGLAPAKLAWERTVGFFKEHLT